MNRLSVLENVLIGALGSTPFWRTCFSWFTGEQKQRALQALTRVGMVHFAHQRVSTLRYCERIVALRQGHVFYDGSSQQFDNERFDHLYRSINRVEENAKAA